MPGTSAAIVGVLAANNAIAAAESTRRHEEHCNQVLATFDSHGATIGEKQHYAGCVLYLYPTANQQRSDASMGGMVILVAVVWAAYAFWGMSRFLWNGYACFAWQVAPLLVLAAWLMM